MTDLEALALLQERARALARPLQIGAAFATLGLGVVFTGAAVLLQWAIVSVAEVHFSIFVGMVFAIAVVPWAFNKMIKALLARRRMEWIDELARTEGTRREMLEESFTLDSW